MNNPSYPTGSGSVLVLEDSATLVTQISRALRAEFPQLRILTARGVSEAQVLVAEYPIDLFLLDIHLPDGTGIDFLCDVKTEQPGAKVIIFTAVPLPEYREQAQSLGVITFLEKPIDFPRLCEHAAQALGLRSTPDTAQGPQSFAASLSCLTPVDIIQLKCLGRSNQVLEFIRADQQRGRIHFREGEVIHAETSRRRGVEAFNEIVGWRGGQVIEVNDAALGSRTIHHDWQHLLMQAVQILDEQALDLAS